MTPAERARDFAAAGRVEAAVDLLTAAGAAGDADAAMLLAVWYLTGDRVARDLRRARLMLNRAVAIGHVDAALMEIAFTANGSGGPADWQAARALLEIAARHDPLAGQHLDLLRQMAIDADGRPTLPRSGEILIASPRVERFPALFTPAECAHVAAAAADVLEPTFVFDPRTGHRVPHPVRTSDGGAIGPAREDLVVQALNRRIAAVSETQVEQGEPLTILRYRPGQQYRPHLDTITGAANQRIKTVLVYLNEGYAGGETRFDVPALTIEPKGGDAIVFENILPDGRADPASRHAGLPVTRGTKWLATRWIRAMPVDPWTLSAD